MQYFYEALDSTGQTVVGKVDGNSVEEARSRILVQGYQLRSLAPDLGSTGTLYAQNFPAVVPQQQSVAPSPAPSVVNAAPPALTQRRTGGAVLAGNAAKVASKAKTRPVARQIAPGYSLPQVANVSNLGGVNDKERMLFFQQLQSLVHAGMTLYMALDNLAPRTDNRNLALVAKEMAAAARTGNPVSEVMARYPHIFPEHNTAILRGGELGGFVEIALSEIATDYEQRVALYRWVWIPKALFALSYCGLPFVIPLFPSFFKGLAAGSPALFYTLYVKQLAVLIPLFALFPVLAIFAARKFNQPQHRYARDSWSLKIQPFGSLQRHVALGNFVRMLGRLHHAGVSPVQAWESAMLTASNVVIRDKLAQSYEIMQRGATLGDAFAETGLFGNSIEQLIITGEQSGQIGEMLDRANAAYQQTAEEAKKKAQFAMLRIGILAMMIAGGFTVCWMAYSYFHGVFSFTDSAFLELNN